MALVSARATTTAVEIVSLMSSTYLYALCEAVDLRAINEQFLIKLKPEIQNLISNALRRFAPNERMQLLHTEIWSTISQSLAEILLPRIHSTTSSPLLNQLNT
jgi:phenylalanine ammonia-lyase